MSERNKAIHLAIPNYIRPGKPACGIETWVSVYKVAEKLDNVNCQWCRVWWEAHQTDYSTDVVRKIVSNEGYDFFASHWGGEGQTHHPICGVQSYQSSFSLAELKRDVTCTMCRDILNEKVERPANLTINMEQFAQGLTAAVAEALTGALFPPPAIKPGPYMHYRSLGGRRGVCGWTADNAATLAAQSSTTKSHVTCPVCKLLMNR